MMNLMKSDSLKNRNKLRKFALMACLLISGQPLLVAADIQKEFFLSSDVTHQSNPTFVDQNKSPVTIFRIEPRVNLTYQTDLDKIYLNSALAIFRNSNEDFFPDRENPNVALGWEKTLKHGLFGLEASYIEDIAIFELLNRTGTAVGNALRNETRAKQIQAKFNHQFNDVFSIENLASYRDVTYSEPGAGGLVDFTMAKIDSRVLYLISPTLSSYVQLGYENFDPDQNINNLSEIDVQRIRFGALYLPSENLTVDANIGYYHANGDNSESGALVKAVATYVRERMTYNFEASRDLIAGGIFGLQKTDALVLGADYLFSEVQTIGAQFIHNKLEINTGDIQFQSIGGYYEHTFETWVARISATRAQLDNGVTKNDNNLLMASFIYGPLSF